MGAGLRAEVSPPVERRIDVYEAEDRAHAPVAPAFEAALFGYYVLGAALDETSGYAEVPSAAEPVGDDYMAAECPRLAAAAPYFKRPYFESTFELGFEVMLKDIAALREVLLSNSTTKPAGRPKP